MFEGNEGLYPPVVSVINLIKGLEWELHVIFMPINIICIITSNLRPLGSLFRNHQAEKGHLLRSNYELRNR